MKHLWIINSFHESGFSKLQHEQIFTTQNNRIIKQKHFVLWKSNHSCKVTNKALPSCLLVTEWVWGTQWKFDHTTMKFRGIFCIQGSNFLDSLFPFCQILISIHFFFFFLLFVDFFEFCFHIFYGVCLLFCRISNTIKSEEFSNNKYKIGGRGRNVYFHKPKRKIVPMLDLCKDEQQ